MAVIMGPKFVSNPKQAFANSNKKRLIALLLILIALPVTVVLALTQQSFINRASGPEIAKVEVSPGIIIADINDGPIHISALAYNSSNVPVEGNVQYSWSMSSSNTVGTLSKVDGNVTEFTPLNFGCGQLTVSANYNGVITKSISVAVFDGKNDPGCISSNEITVTPVPQVLKTSVFATADAFVRGGRANKNYGTKIFLATHKGKKMISYMKFDLRSMQGKEIKKATLKLRVLWRSKSKWAPSKNTQNMRLVGNSWTERGITFNNKPNPGSPITTFKGNSYGKVLTLDVTDEVIQKNGGYVSFSINSDGNDMMAIYSRESNNNRPSIEIEYH